MSNGSTPGQYQVCELTLSYQILVEICWNQCMSVDAKIDYYMYFANNKVHSKGNNLYIFVEIMATRRAVIHIFTLC